MGKGAAANLADEARSLLHLFGNSSEGEMTRHADDVLSFFRKLHDSYRITKSQSPRFSGTTFIILEEVMYELEARPDATLRSGDFREFITAVLYDISSGRVRVAAKNSESI
ncbi:MAG: hypothetical protein ABSF91_11225 [Bacteroidota bacterium]|jgi:hypothetical protein